MLQRIAALDHQAHLTFETLGGSNPTLSESFDLLIDGLLGTGVTRTQSDKYLEVVAWMNNQQAPTVALDLPTGLHADTGEILGDAVKADCTVTMGALKSGLLLGEGPAFTGDVKVVEIGIPELAIEKAAQNFGVPRVVTKKAVQSWLPQRTHASHKYSVGMALALAGSDGLSGAATLAATSAARSGAGAVICACPESIQPVLATKMTEVMTVGLPTTQTGIDQTEALALLEKPLSKATSLLVGCGLGSKPDTQAFARDLLIQANLPAVVDADGLNAFIGKTELITAHADGKWILTPHLGEFKRLAGEDVNLKDRVSTVRQYAQSWNCILLLKGAPSIVGTPTGEVFINPIINPAFATAGTGDVLAGLCAGFLAQGLSPVKSALAALYLGGEAANLYTSNHHPSTMLASDLIDQFTLVLNDYKH